jgi:hypothetical protein
MSQGLPRDADAGDRSLSCGDGLGGIKGCATAKVKTVVETYPLAEAAKVCERVAEGKARFCSALTRRAAPARGIPGSDRYLGLSDGAIGTCWQEPRLIFASRRRPR